MFDIPLLDVFFRADSLWAILFISLLTWVLRTNDTREKRYIQIIDQLGDKLEDKLNKIENYVCELREDKRRR